MQSRRVQVPGPIRLDRRLAESARLARMFCQLDARVPAARVPESLSRRTVQCGVGQLQAAGWVRALTRTR